MSQSVEGRMPILFVGHGSPMNAIDDNAYTRNWTSVAGKIPKPKAILSISAHWYISGSRVNDAPYPQTIYDMYGFPDELYQMQYNAVGSPETARQTKSLISHSVEIDNNWGIDHGTWSVLCRMYPKADIPLFQLSVDRNADPETHFQIGREIGALRDHGVLIIGSGNIVHNLSEINWNMSGGYTWADEFDQYVKSSVQKKQYQDIIHYEKAGQPSKLAFNTPDHFYPLLYVLGASGDDDQLSVFNDSCTMGSLSMTSYLFFNT